MPTILGRTASIAWILAVLLGASSCDRQPAAAATPPMADADTGRGPMPIPAKTERPPRWSGSYVYEFDGGKTAGGSAVIVTYTLTLDGSGCRFEAEGFQTDEAIICTTRPSATALDVLFKSYGDGSVQDKYGNAVYSVGDPLFSLSQGSGGIVTHWKGYPLPDDRRHAPGTYFHR